MTTFPRSLATVTCSLLLSFPLATQNSGVTASRPGWHPRQYFTGANPQIPRADRAIIEANLAAAEALVVKSQGYATPRGFEITPWWAYATARSRDRLSSYQMQIHAHVPSRKAAAGGYIPTVVVIFNPDVPLCDAGGIKDEDGQQLYFEPSRAAAMHGATAVYGTFGEPNTIGLCVLFTSGGESPLLPVSRERYLRALIFELEGKERSVVGDGLRAKIAAMTPAERASQGWVFGTDLVAAGTPGAQRVLKENPAFYRARRSPVEPRAILVHLFNVPTEVMAAHSQLYRQFDWAALKRLVDAP